MTPSQMVGTCERCKAWAPLFVVCTGALREPYCCEPCAVHLNAHMKAWAEKDVRAFIERGRRV